MTNTIRQKRRDTTVAWLFVVAQFLLLGTMVFYPRDAAWTAGASLRTVGLLLMGVGVALGLWSSAYLGRGLTPLPLPNGGTDLVTRGPYRLIRHPIYVSVAVLGGGIVLRSGSAIVSVAFFGLILLFAVKARWEEMHLIDSFPGYERYMEDTGRFVPTFDR